MREKAEQNPGAYETDSRRKEYKNGFYTGHVKYVTFSCLIIFRPLGADFKNNQTTKQLNNFIWTNRKVETKLYLLPIGPNKMFNCLVVFKIRSLERRNSKTLLTLELKD